MSIVNVLNYGAASGGDVTVAIQGAIDGAVSGDTIYFPQGTYQVSTITLRSNLTYHGDAGAVLQGASLPMVTVQGQDSHDIRVDGLTFRGTGSDPNYDGLLNLSGDGSASSVNHITISNSTFDGGGLVFDFLKNSQIINDHFANFPGNAVLGYHLDNSAISSNNFTEVTQAISLVFDSHVPEQGRNVVIDHNVGTGMSRMGIEAIGNDPPINGDSTNLRVEGNWFTNWHGGVTTDTMAYSIVVDGGTGTQVLNNYAQGTLNTGYGIELSGPNAIAQGNYIDGFYEGIIGYARGDTIQNNNIINSASGVPIDTYGRDDEIVQNNTFDPSLPLPLLPHLTDYLY
jgi:polygalacturonase